MDTLTSYDKELAAKLLKEWQEWVDGGGKVEPPNWPYWSGRAVAVLKSVVGNPF